MGREDVEVDVKVDIEIMREKPNRK